MAINLILLILGFIFTFFVPGFLVIELFFNELPAFSKLPLYLLISVLFSTYAVYFISLIFGFSRTSIIITFFVFGLALLILLLKRRKGISLFYSFKEHAGSLLLSIIIFALFFAALYPAIFYPYKNYFVMSAVNWQDTAMHQSIIESISQGNFPPQAPYFSGQSLNYYYFVDFHSAILETLYGQFFPRILVYDNPFFVMIFFLSVYVLSYYLFASKLAGIISGLLAVFSGNFLYFKLFQDILNINSVQKNLFTIVKNINVGSYTFDYGQLMQMTPLANYFLQNRPMMIGLPAVVVFILLLMYGFHTNRNKYFVLASLLAAMLTKFQLFAFIVCLPIFLLSLVILQKRNFKQNLFKMIYFCGPLVIFIIFSALVFRSNNRILDTFQNTFRFGPWDQTKDFFWYLSLSFANLGIPFSLFVIYAILAIFKKINLTKETIFILVLATVLWLIPFIITFTIYGPDMLKFYYLLVIPISLISGLLLQRFLAVIRFGRILVILLIIVSSFGSYLTLAWSYLNKNIAYSQEEYRVGIWLRENTSPQSVFLTMPTVHSAVSEIGGRLRVLSYTNWPYSHGFNRGADNVFTRQADVESIYRDSANIENAKRILTRYHVNYIYFGSEEKNAFPFAQNAFDRQDYLKLVYDLSGIKIYKVI